MNSRESIYLFCGWLTTRSEVTTMGASHDCSPIPLLIEEFCNKHNLPPVTEDYPYTQKQDFERQFKEWHE